MDPNAVMDRLNTALCDENWQDVVEAVDALETWIEKGGFRPTTPVRVPKGTPKFIVRTIVRMGIFWDPLTPASSLLLSNYTTKEE